MTTKVTFNLPAEYVHNASEGVLVGEFNNWNPEEGVQLTKKEDGSMYAEIALAPGQSYQYRYLLNDGRWVNDYSSTIANNVYGQPVENCIIEVPAATIAKAAVKTTVAASKKEAAPKKEAAAKKATAPKKEAAAKKVAAPKKAAATKKPPVSKDK